MRLQLLLLLYLFMSACSSTKNENTTSSRASIGLVTRGMVLQCTTNNTANSIKDVHTNIYNGTILTSESSKIALSTVRIRTTFSNLANSNVNCTGIIIGAKTILTAAHCFTNPKENTDLKNLTALTINYGLDTNNQEFSYTDKSIIKIPLEYKTKIYKNTNILYADYAVINLPENIPTGFTAVTLLKNNSPALTNLLTSGNALTIAGFGINNSDDTSSMGTLRSGISIYDHLETKGNFIVTNEETSEYGTCPGDSGGPLFIKKNTGSLILIGVTMAGFGFANSDKGSQCGGISLYTNIQAYYTNISSLMKETPSFENSTLSAQDLALDYCQQ